MWENKVGFKHVETWVSVREGGGRGQKDVEEVEVDTTDVLTDSNIITVVQTDDQCTSFTSQSFRHVNGTFDVKL